MKKKWVGVFIFFIFHLSCLLSQPFSPDENTLFLCHFEKTIIPDFAKGNKEFVKSGDIKLFKNGKFGNCLLASKKEGIDTFAPSDYSSDGKEFKGVTYYTEGNIDEKQGTIEMWAKFFFSFDSPESSYLYTLFSTNTEKGGLFVIGVFSTKGGKRGFVFTISDPEKNIREYGILNYNIEISSDRWYHIAVTWDEKEIILIIDNKKLGARKRPEIIPIGKTFTIGGVGYKARGIADALIDEVRISNIVRYKEEKETKSSELLQNPGFERGLFGWEITKLEGADGQWSVEKKFSKTGENALFIKKTNGLGAIKISTSDFIQVTPKVEYRFRAYRHIKEVPFFSIYGCRTSLELEGYTKGGEKLSVARTSTRQSVPVVSKPDQWNLISLWFTPDQNIEKVKLNFIIEGNPIELWLDDFSFSIYNPDEDKKPFRLSPPEAKLSWEETLKFLNSLKEAKGEIKQIKGIPRLLINGDPVPPIFYRMRGKRNHGYCKDFNDADVKIQVVSVPIGGAYGEVWKGPGKYDFEPIDSRIKFSLQGNPDGYIVVAMQLGPYSGWEDEHIDEITRDQDGLFAMGRYEREYFGIEKKKEGDHGIYSYYSDLLQKQINECIIEVMNFLKKQPYYKSIVGFTLTGGHDGQWFTSQQPDHLIDYSPASIKSFREFMKEKYKTDDNLRKIFNRKEISFDKLMPPSKEERTKGTFRDPVKDKLTVDFSEFLSVKLARFILSFAKTIKENAGKSVFVTSYYRDLMGGISRHHTAIREILNSNYIDIMHGCIDYNPRRQPGGPGNIHVCLGSYKLHSKIWLQELDYRTWVSPPYNPKLDLEHLYIKNIDDFKAINYRDLGAMIAKQNGVYYFDLTGGYFHDKSIMDVISFGKKIYQNLISKNTEFKPDIAVIVDEKSCYYVSDDYNVIAAVNRCLWAMDDSLYLSGVPFDVYLMEDLLKYPELKNYKVYFFLNTFFMQQEEREFIERNLKKNGKILVWMYAPGYIDEKKKSVENIYNLTGIKVKTKEDEKTQMSIEYIESPFTKGLNSIVGSVGKTQKFWIEDENIIPFARYREGKEIAGAVKNFSNWTSVYFCAPIELPPSLINNISSFTNAYICSESGIPIWVNNDFIALHGTKTGEKEIFLPRYCKKIKNVFTGEIVGENTQKIKIKIPLHETLWFILE